MNLNSKRLTIAIAILSFALGPVQLSVSFAEPGLVVPGETVAMTAQQTTGILTTKGNKEILVNATNSMSGATIVSGASIETPAGVSATVSLGGSRSLQIGTNTKLTAEFDKNVIKVRLTEGCVNLRTKKGTIGEIITPKGSAGKTDPAQDGQLETCPPRSAEPVVADAGAVGLFRLGKAAALAVIARGETALAIPVAPRGVLY